MYLTALQKNNYFNQLSAGCGVYSTWKQRSGTIIESETTSGWKRNHKWVKLKS